MLADTPAPPYCAVIFTSQRTDVDAEGYAEMAQLMDTLARRQPGFLGVESARTAAGLGITVAYWRSAADARAWKGNVEHLAAQKLGREKWYRAYRVRIAEVQREYGYSVV